MADAENNQDKIKFGSVCSGIEAASAAWEPLGFSAHWLSEIEPFPSKVLAHRFPLVPNLGDMTKLPDMVLNKEIPAPDVLVGGTPCFTAGHFVLTSDGYKAIEDIKVGDKVITHEGRLQKVVRIGSKMAKVGLLNIKGALPFTCTPEHPFYAFKENSFSWVDASLLRQSGVMTCSLIKQNVIDDSKHRIGTERYPQHSTSGLSVGFLYTSALIDDIVFALEEAEYLRKHGLEVTLNKDSGRYRLEIIGKQIKSGQANDDKFQLYEVESWKDLQEDQEVFNIEVEGDNSYILNGMVVHNCQAFSIAGMRAGLSDPRGALTISYVRLIDAIDEIRTGAGKPAGVALWENVPGVLSSNDNAFGTFMGALAGEDFPLEPEPRPVPGKSSRYWRWKKEKDGGIHVPKWPESGCVFGPKRTIVWRVLDAQYFELAQRRKRVFVIASSRTDIDPVEILLEFEGVRRDSAPSREAGQGFTHDVAPCLTSSGRGVERCGDTRGQDPVVAELPAGFSTSGAGFWREGIGALRARTQDSHENLVAASTEPTSKPVARMNKLAWSIRTANTSSNGWGIQTEVTHTLDATAGPAVLMVGVPKQMAFQQNTRDEVRFMGGDGQIAGALAAQPGMKQQNYIFKTDPEPFWVNGRQDPIHNQGLSGPLDTFDGTNVVTQSIRKALNVFAIHPHCIGRAPTSGPQGREYNDTGAGYTMDSSGQSQAVAFTDADIDNQLRVRRLMPVECERLQGFPDGWTHIPVSNGKKTTMAVDGPRYKALGNSMAVPAMRWIGNRIKAQIENAE